MENRLTESEQQPNHADAKTTQHHDHHKDNDPRFEFL